MLSLGASPSWLCLLFFRLAQFAERIQPQETTRSRTFRFDTLVQLRFKQLCAITLRTSAAHC